MKTIEGKSALEIGAMLQSGVVDAETVTEDTLSAIAAAGEPGLFTLMTPDRARAEARAAAVRLREGRAMGPLDGVPIAWKDLFDLAGEVTTAGSRILAADPPAAADAPVVQQLKAAGMVTVGRVGMTEFAYSGLGLNPHYGTPRNPRGGAVERIPGGSSSGSGVAVARGLVPVSIGTDTGGSVRIPAAFNGIVGYKATHGRYPMEGVFPLSRSLDSLGVLCRRVADAAMVDAAMRGLHPSEVTRGTSEEVVLVVPTNVVFDEAEPEVVAQFDRAIDRLVTAGFSIDRRPVPALDAVMALNARHGALGAAEAYQLHAARVAGPEAERMDPRVATRIRGGAKITAADLATIHETRSRLIVELRYDLGPHRMLAYPTVAHVAPRLQPLEAEDALYLRTNALTLRNTMLGNMLRLCGVSLPCGFGADGLPIGFLLSALGGADMELLGLALEIESLIRED